MCSDMRIPVEVNFSPLYTVTSRNVTSVLLASKVNLIVLWIFGLFVSCRCDVKVFIWGSPDGYCSRKLVERYENSVSSLLLPSSRFTRAYIYCAHEN